MTEAGERLETVRILNDRERLAAVMARAGEAPEAVLEATYGWYWAADTLAALGASVHLAQPLGVKAFTYRRVKTTNATRPIWPTWCGWAAFRRPGSRRRQPATCASWSGTAPRWSRCARTSPARSMRCWPAAGCP